MLTALVLSLAVNAYLLYAFGWFRRYIAKLNYDHGNIVGALYAQLEAEERRYALLKEYTVDLQNGDVK